MRVDIFPAARLRLLEIWNYTEAEWGEAQADAYVSGLVETINSLEDTRQQPWRRVPGRTIPGAWFVRYRHHFIFSVNCPPEDWASSASSTGIWIFPGS
jgi:plasmid stabilization system protein ParE